MELKVQVTVSISDTDIKSIVGLIVTGVTSELIAQGLPLPLPVPLPLPLPLPVTPPREILTLKPGIDVLAALTELQVKKGPYKGMFLVAPAGVGNWYFANLGLQGIIPYMDNSALEALIRPYLDLYISKLRSDYTIDDVGFPGGIDFPETTVLHISDSDDSYASTFTSLVLLYVKASGNTAWWNSNSVVINEIMTRNCLIPIKPNNLTSTFTPTNIQKIWDVGYFMDNCEVYRGLRDAATLNKDNVAVANTFSAGADRIAVGLRGLWAETGFRYADAAPILRTTDKALYPDGACQVFAEAFGVTELRDLFDKSYTYLNNSFPGWETGNLDAFPFAVLGYVSALRQDFTRAKTQVSIIEEKFTLSRPHITLNELGWYSKTRAIVQVT